jgi:hypothetical protein
MSTGAVFYFNMRGFNKQAITPDFAAKHMSYILNRNKVRAVGSQHAPSDYYAAQDWLTRHLQAGRKNARVWTRLIVNLPYDLTHAQRVRLITLYLAELSQGRAPFVWAIHDDTRAPHAHVVFVDKDVRTGKRVAQLTEAGSAQRWRKVWEECCNQALAWSGSIARVSRWGKRSLHHQQLNEQARAARELAPATTTTGLSPAGARMEDGHHVHRVAPDRHQTPREVNRPGGLDMSMETKRSHDEQEKPMDAVIKQELHTPSISAVVAFVASQVVELQRLRAARQTIADYRASYAQVTANLIKTQARMETIDPELQRSGARVVKAEQETARHSGIVQRLWQIISPAARARAKAARTASQMALYTLSTTRIKANNLLREAQSLQAEQTALHEKANALKSSLAIYGTDEDLDDAEKSLKRTITVNTAELSSVELSQALLAGDITPEEHRHLMLAVDRGGHGV